MYIYNSLPVAFTLPVAIYFHAQKVIHTPSGGSSQDGFDGGDVINEGHPTIKGYSTSDEESSSSSYESLAFARLMELTFGGRGSYQFSLMELDTLTNTFSYVNYETFDVKGFACDVISHIIFALVCLTIFEHTVFGMCCKIAMRKIRRSSTHILLVSRSLLNPDNIIQRVESWASSASTINDETEEKEDLLLLEEDEGEDDDDFQECDNNNSFVAHNSVVREESVPKTNHLEEKLLFRSVGNSSSSTSSLTSSSVASSTTSMDTSPHESHHNIATTAAAATDAATMATTLTVDNWCQQDSGVMVAAMQSVGTTMSHDNHIGIMLSSSALSPIPSSSSSHRTKEISVSTDPTTTSPVTANATAQVNARNIFNSTFAYNNNNNNNNNTTIGEASPEKFKRFLHERNDDIERLGISFDSDYDDTGDDGYLDESDDDVNKSDKKSDKSNGHNTSLWERVTLLV